MVINIRKVKDKYGYAIVADCSEKGCSLCIDNVNRDDIVILKGEKITRSRKVCDCLIFVKRKANLLIIIVELKRKSIDVSVIKKKFENTIDLLKDIIIGFEHKTTPKNSPSTSLRKDARTRVFYA